jgi:hypothetical protein
MYRPKLHSPQWYRKRNLDRNFVSNVVSGSLKRDILKLGGDYDTTHCDVERLDYYEELWNGIHTLEKGMKLPKVGFKLLKKMEEIMVEEAERDHRLSQFQSESFKKIENILEKNNLTHNDLAAYIRWTKKNLKPKREKKSELKMKANSNFFKKPKKKFGF